MSKGSFFKGLLAGIVTGASFGVLAGLLSAPKSGKELRADLQHYFEQLSSEVQKRAKKLEVASHKAYEKVVDEVMEAYEKMKSFDKEDFDSLRKALMKEWDRFTHMQPVSKKAAK